MSPIVLFIYNRPSHTQQTLEALSQNTLAQNSDLIIFADGPKENATQDQIKKIQETRKVAKSKQWCKSVEIRESEKNKGLAKSIIDGVTEIVDKYGTIIVLEDDIVTGKYFLEYMNTALEKYKNEKKVWHVTGWHEPLREKIENPNNAFFYPVMDCWSWATWSDRWQYFEKNTDRILETWTPRMIKRFNHDGTEPGMWSQIIDNKLGKINTWAIYWYASIFEHNGLCLAPTKSLVKNIGFDNSGVHCGKNPNEEIIDSIDFKVLYYPQKFNVYNTEWKKIKKYNLQNHGKDFKSKIKRVIKFPYRCLRKIYRVSRKIVFPEKIIGTTFMLHRVDDWEEGKLFSNENMKVTPEKLQKTIDSLKKTHSIISSTQINDYIKAKNKKPFAVFTMDDGYKDNFTKAYPVFKKNNVPFTIFLATDFPDKKAVLWWYVLEDLIHQNNEIKLSNGKTYPCYTKEMKEKSFLDIRLEILALDQVNLLEELNKLFSGYDIDWFSRTEELCMSWNDVEELSKDPLVTIGGHTKHHYNLKALYSENEVVTEVKFGIEILNQHNVFPSVFAYPFGSSDEVGKREINILSKMNLKNSFLAYGNETTNKNSKNLYSLPRKFFTMDTKI